LELYQIKKVLQNKGNHRVKKQPAGWEKIFVNHISDNRLISRICEASYNSIAREQMSLSKNRKGLK
jgi:hypothetical protein